MKPSQRAHTPRQRHRLKRYAAILTLFLLAMLPRALTYTFSLPYVDHPDEPAAYLKALEARGLFDLQGYHQGYPPAYIVLEAAVQTWPGGDMAAVIRQLRWISALADALVAVLIALSVQRLIGARPRAMTAGWVAGLVWAVSPPLVERGVYALPDPLVTLCAILSFHLAVIAVQEPRRRYWSIWSVAIGLLAVALKYNALPALLPGGLAALGLFFTAERTRAIRLLMAQVGLCLLAAILLLVVYRADLINTPGTSDVVRGQGLANALNVSRIVANLRLTLQPLPPLFILPLVGLPFAIIGWIRGRSSAGSLRYLPLLGLPLIVGFPWIASAFSEGDTDSLRFVLPATAAVLIVAGVMLWWAATLAAALLRTRRARAVQAVLVLFGVFAVLAPLPATLRLIEDRGRPDWRVALRTWADASLEPGLVLVDYANHKTFNPFWSGLTGQAWFEWLVVNDFSIHPPDSWRSERGAVYATLPYRVAQEHPELTAHWLHLRDFAGRADRRGPEVAVYRLWKPERELRAEFGDAVALVGVDLQPALLAPGAVVEMRPYWQVLAPVQADYSAFVHLVRDGEDTPLAQADGAPARPMRPTTTWDWPGETVIGGLFRLTLPDSLAPGEYALRLGLYDYLTGMRLQAADGREWVEIARLRIP